MNDLQEIVLKLDSKTLNYLSDEIRKKRISASANTFSDKFLIRLVESLNKRDKISVFKIKENNRENRESSPIVKTYKNL